MADLPEPVLRFDPAYRCPDCGAREVLLPAPLAQIGDDFDWGARDYDGIRKFIFEELAARFQERERWTPADMEAVLVEALAALLDQYSDMLDRVSAEAFLESARRPESVRRLLKIVGYDAVDRAIDRGEIAPEPEETRPARLDAFWLLNPHAMDRSRAEGPLEVHTQRRIVTLGDYATRLEEHPLLLRAHAWIRWSGSWTTVRVAVVGWDNQNLDTAATECPDEVKQEVDDFHKDRDLPKVDWSGNPTLRTVARPYVEHYRMAGQEVLLEDAVPVPVMLSLSIRVSEHYFRSETKRAVEEALGTGPDGYFRPGRLRFGEDLHAGDVIETLMALDGVEHVCLNRFKRLGSEHPDVSSLGRIVLDGLEIAVCDNDPARPERGYFKLILHGGEPG